MLTGPSDLKGFAMFSLTIQVGKNFKLAIKASLHELLEFFKTFR